MLTTADFSDRDGAIHMFEYYISFTQKLSCLQKVIVNGNYNRIVFANAIKSLAEAEVVKRNELHKFTIIPKRLVLERTFGWLDKCRMLWKNCERRLHNTLKMDNISVYTDTASKILNRLLLIKIIISALYL